MKLRKSKLALAKVINENGGWPERAQWAVQDNCIAFFRGGKPEYKSGDRCWYSNSIDGACVGTITCDGKVTNWHQTVLSREEYYQSYPNVDADGWIERIKSAQQADVFSVVDVRFRDGGAAFGPAHVFDWSVDGGEDDIIAYRLHTPEVKPELCESVMRSIPEPEAKPTIEQLAADYRNAKGYADRKRDEADKASMESDAALSQLEDAIAAIGFIITPLAATEKEPELVAAVKVGDQVECVESNIKRDKYNGMVGRLHFIDEIDTSTPYLVDFGGEAKIWCHEVKFISRP